jgi:hypothetical protein
MPHLIAIGWPGPFEIIILLLFFAVPILVIFLVVRAATSRRSPQMGFPVALEDGPGSYRVSGVDKQTRADRSITVQAESRANAQVKAELDGMIVTNVTKVP